MDLDRAVEIFRRAWAESAAAEYFATVERDVITSMHQARKTGPQPLIDLAYRRRGLVMAVIAPAILLFRFPWLAIGAMPGPSPFCFHFSFIYGGRTGLTAVNCKRAALKGGRYLRRSPERLLMLTDPRSIS